MHYSVLSGFIGAVAFAVIPGVILKKKTFIFVHSPEG